MSRYSGRLKEGYEDGGKVPPGFVKMNEILNYEGYWKSIGCRRESSEEKVDLCGFVVLLDAPFPSDRDPKA
jgi:hypothetical protein